MSQVWAVAALLLREVTRKPGFRLFCLALFALAFFLPRWAPGDELLARLQLAATYGLGFPVVLLALATLVYSTGSLSHDIDSRAIHLVTTKPIRRWKLLLGKVVGLGILNGGLLLGLVLVFGVHLWSFSSGVEHPGARDSARHRFFSPRTGTFPDAPPVDEARVAQLIAQWAHDGKHPEDAMHRAQLLVQTRPVSPGADTELRFHGLPSTVTPGDTLQLRFRLFFSPLQLLEVEVFTRWEFRNSRGRSITKKVTVSNSGLHRIDVDAGLVGEDGELSVVLRNDEPGPEGVTLIVGPENVELLHVSASFWPNLGRALLLVLGQLTFLATLGVFGSALFSLPTASLLGFSVYLFGLVSGFLKESLHTVEHASSDPTLLDRLGAWCVVVLEGVLHLLPDLAAENPIGKLVEGRAIPPVDLTADLAWILGVRCGVVFLVAAWIWSRRELGGGRS